MLNPIDQLFEYNDGILFIQYGILALNWVEIPTCAQLWYKINIIFSNTVVIESDYVDMVDFFPYLKLFL
jgi:hypothetical protein